ncbi:D-TA family PLP-dependent enzyme [Flavihumibacter stibioxidans]|uniref:Threonine aldolase n=1 Tax=Flavihumibacter stibioxidans TaxID=1834163 RepID=A0ABR7MBI2_9BACT|nr:D-TA family PLP-dependent enzyme [Flavihumibacter stibioxidans]MBC6492403.1 threonine aldolase [Flavihumibacter stibioxidans]
MENNKPWYQIDGADMLDSPALVVFPERVKQNIQAAIAMVGSPSRLRPHVKTHKAAEVCRLMLDAGIHQFKCSTIAEAEMLALEGARDVLLAYQPVGPKVDRLLHLASRFPQTTFSCLVDDPFAASVLSAKALDKNLVLPVYLDLNVGMNRTGITAGDAAVQLYVHVSQLDGLRIFGLHAYDGHIRETDLTLRTRQVDEAFGPVYEMIDSLEKQGYPVPALIAGGSPSFPVHAKREREICSPGTFVYWDKGYGDKFPDQPFVHAALVVTRVVSKPGTNRITVDLGHKSIAAENELANRVFFLNAAGLVPVGQSEEHLVLETAHPEAFQVGDLLYGVPYHICPTVALHQFATTIEDHRITGRWMTVSRDRFLTI